MKNFILTTTAFLILISCNKNGFKNYNGVVFISEKLNGHYKMDITPFVDQQFEKSEGKSKSKKLAANIAALAFQSSVSVDLFF